MNKHVPRTTASGSVVSAARRAMWTGVVFATLAFGAVEHAKAADLEAGRALVESNCAACHGRDAKSPIDPSYPKLAGQYDDYLAKALGDYQSGARKNGVMGGMAKPLSKQDIANVAAYLSQLPGPLSHRN